jgi:hypothetical protein
VFKAGPSILPGQSRVFVMGSGLCGMVKKLRWRSTEDRSIKWVSVEGKLKRFKRPVYVKEIVEEYPHHGIFDSGTMKRLGTNVLNRPLDHNSELQPGQLYNVIPLPSAGSRLEELKQNSNSGAEIISTSSIQGSPALRVKLRMRKEDVASFLKSTNISFADNFVLKGAPSLAMGQQSYKSGQGITSEWKPSLDTIPELNSHQTGK